MPQLACPSHDASAAAPAAEAPAAAATAALAAPGPATDRRLGIIIEVVATVCQEITTMATSSDPGPGPMAAKAGD